jgi:hypothetical protein
MKNQPIKLTNYLIKSFQRKSKGPRNNSYKKNIILSFLKNLLKDIPIKEKNIKRILKGKPHLA